MALASSSSASVAVEKATSDLLIGPDWTMNIDICDSINSNHWLAKDVVKALKKRLQHKNPKVQLLALTLLETMVKNCGDYIHFQLAEKNILGEMVKIVRKKTDMHVRHKILVLLDAWQEAFGGPGGKHPQYYWAYEELRRSGVEFPQRSLDAAPIFTPPVSNSTLRPAQAAYGMPSNSSRRLDETMATEIEGLSLSTLESMRNVMELLSDMLQAVDDREAVKDEIIVDLVNHCRSNQKKLMQMLTTTGDEELLGQGLELNDSLQVLLAKHDAIASGSPIPTQTTYLEPKPSLNSKPAEVKDSVPSSSTNASMPVANVTRSYIDEEDEEEDDFAQLARRHSKTEASPSQSSNGTSQALVPVDTINATSTTTASQPAACNALALVDQPAPLSTMKEQEIIDLLNITLSTSSTSHQPHTSYAPPTSNQSIPQAPASNTHANPYVSQTYPGNQGQTAYNTYVVPWAQPQSQHQSQMPAHTHTQSQLQQAQFQHQHQPHPQSHSLHQPHHQQQFQTQSQSPSHIQPQQQQQFQTQAQPQLHAQQQFQTQSQPQLHAQQQFQPQYQSHTEAQLQSQPHAQPQNQQHTGPQLQPQVQTQSQQFPQPQSQPPSQPQQQQAPHSQPQQQFQPQSQPQFQPQSQQQYPQYTSGYVPPPWAATPGYASGQRQAAKNIYSTTQANPTSSYTSAQAARPMHNYNSSNSRGTNGLSMNGDQRVSSAPSGQKSFVPSYRLFEDLNVFGNTDGRFNMTGNASPSLSGPSSQGMVGGRK